ncbi:YHS domain-containing protein [Fodinibius sp.]
MQIDDLATAPNMEYKGKTLYFCCPSCQDTFLEDPNKYINGGPTQGCCH